MTDAERIVKLEKVITDMQKLIAVKDAVIVNYKQIIKGTVQAIDANALKSILPTLRIIAKRD